MTLNITYTFESNNSFIVTVVTNRDELGLDGVDEGSWSFDESDSTEMTLILELIDPDEGPYILPFRVVSISNKRLSAIEYMKTDYDSLGLDNEGTMYEFIKR